MPDSTDFSFDPSLLTADGIPLDSGTSTGTSGGFDWGSTLGTLGQFAGTAATVFTAITNQKAAADIAKANAAAKNNIATATGNSFAKYLPWILGGVVVLVLGAIFLRRK
jgi:hypothetical protein